MRWLLLAVVLLAAVTAAPTASAGHQCTESDPGGDLSFYGGDCFGFRYDLGCGRPLCSGDILVPLH